MKEVRQQTRRPMQKKLSEAYQELKTNEQRYHKMIDEVQDYAIILLDGEGNILKWNKGAEKIKGYTEDEILGKSFSVFYLPEDRKSGLPFQLLELARSQGKTVHEGWRVRKDGSRFWGSVTITTLHGEDDSIIGFLKVTRDLTEKKIAEDQLRASAEELRQKNEQLRLSEERYHQMIAEVQDYAIVLLNTQGDIQNWNAGAESIKGYKASEAIGKNFRIFYTPEDRENKLPEYLMSTATQRGKAVQEGWRVRKDGSRFWGSIVITALHNKSGELIGFSKVTRDLTRKKEADDQLLDYTTKLEIKNQELEQFAYVASHDLQEPLRKIQTFADIIQQSAKDEHTVNRYLNKIIYSSQRMTELIKSVLNYSRLAKDDAEMTNVNLNDVLTFVKTDFELLIDERNVEIKSDVLPVVKGNTLQLGQLFTNLISNAIKFTEKNPVIRICSRLVSKPEGINLSDAIKNVRYYEITFTDNGIGFDPQFEKQIFIIFQRLHNKQQFPGTGIGLALCKRIVENHGGFITAKSIQGSGTTFYVYLPVNE